MVEQSYNESERYKEFLRLLMANQHRIFGFIFALVPDMEAAEDLQQETMLVLWEKYQEFKPGTNFAAWGIQIARNKVYQYYHEKSRRKVVSFSEEALDNLIGNTDVFDQTSERIKALQKCLSEISESDRKLLQMRYVSNRTFKQIAQEIQKPLPGLYKHMAKVHYLLQRCVQRTLAAWNVI